MLLAGGRATRLGGQDKPGLIVGGRTLLASVVSAAVSAGAQRIIVVGPDRPELADGLAFVCEEPPGSGPVPALRRGLAEVSAPVVVVLAADLPFLRARHLRVLLTALAGERVLPVRSAPPAGQGASTSGVIMVDDAGRRQWLAGCWRTAALRAAAQTYTGSSLRGLLGPLEPVLLGPGQFDPAGVGYDQPAGEPPPWLDCDTADDLAHARSWQLHIRHGASRHGASQHGASQHGASQHGDIGPETQQERKARR